MARSQIRKAKNTQAEEHEAHQRKQKEGTAASEHKEILDLQHRAGNQAVNQALRGSSQIPAVSPETEGCQSAEDHSSEARRSGGGRSLEPALQQELEEQFRADFSGVRIHTDNISQRRVMEADAAALTEGNHIYFGPGRFAPSTVIGRELLRHELTHALQQRGNVTAHWRTDTALEQEAHQVSRQNSPGDSRASLHFASAPQGIAQADNAGENELHFRGRAGERGVGVLYVRDWSNLSPREREAIRAFARDMDFQASTGMHRQRVPQAARRTANSVARVGRSSLGLSTGTSAGHTPDVAAGGDPGGPIIGLPSRVNISLGGQWKRYQPGFVFTGFSVYDFDTGQWIYLSGALEHEPPPTSPGPPRRPRQTRAPSGPPRRPRQTRAPSRPAMGQASSAAAGAAVRRSGGMSRYTGPTMAGLQFFAGWLGSKSLAQIERKLFMEDLKTLEPEVDAELATLGPEIEAKMTEFPLVYANIRISYWHGEVCMQVGEGFACSGGYEQGSIGLERITLSHENLLSQPAVVKTEKMASFGALGTHKQYEMTYSSPLFAEESQWQGYSEHVRKKVQRLRGLLGVSKFKHRLSAVLNLAKLAKTGGAPRNLVIADLIAMLRDDDDLLRGVAAAELQGLDATVAIPYLRRAMQETRSKKAKAIIERQLRRLEERAAQE